MFQTQVKQCLRIVPLRSRLLSSQHDPLSHNDKPSHISYIPDFISQEKHGELQQRIKNFRSQIQQLAVLQHQPKVIARKHNLRSKEYLRFVYLHDEDDPTRELCVEHFDTYESDDHELDYFESKADIPIFLHDIMDKVISLPDVNQLLSIGDTPDLPILWKLAMNSYFTKSNMHLSGFSFHRDIASYGDITCILTLEQPAIIGFRPVPKFRQDLTQMLENSTEFSIILHPRSLLIVGNDARWRWEHKVEGCKVNDNEMERISLVFGCRANR